VSKALTWVLAIVIVLAAIAFGGRAYASRVMSRKAVTPKALGSNTPASVDLRFSRLAIESGDRTLIGWWVRAPADTGKVPPALLFLHGNRSAISDYVGLQQFLHRQGISSLVFDYSGFGASGGTASLTNAIADAAIVARVFADSAGQAARKTAMGSALGATVLLQAIDSVQSHVDGVVIEGVDASVRESAVKSGRIPAFAAGYFKEPANNVEAAARVRVPLLAVQSYADPRTPLEYAQRVVAAVPGRAALVRHWRKGHSAILSSSRPCDWAPVITFVKLGGLPATKLDTTDVCQVETARLAAVRDSTRVADSVKAATKATQPSPPTRSKSAPPPATKTKTGTGTKRPAPATKRPLDF
jgi:hypothetical protein